MGIKGFGAFIQSRPEVLEPYELCNTRVVIDGNNLIYHLYKKNNFDSHYGGEYPRYAATVMEFFALLTKCNIEPIVIFDGGCDKNNPKNNHVKAWKEQFISKHEDMRGDDLLPLHCPQVFCNVLVEMKIPFARCEFEADGQVSALANHYNCPVLSNDGDFYIFYLCQGFIRLDSVDLPGLETTTDGVKSKCIKCNIYRIDKFLSYFPKIDRNALPLLATLIGNDYVERGTFRNFLSDLKILKAGVEVKITFLVNWLNCRVDEAIERVLNYFSESERDGVRSSIAQSMENYSTKKCNLTFVIEDDLEGLERALEADRTLTTQCGQALPIPFMVSYHKGNFPPLFLNIINHHRTWLPFQKGDSHQSSYECSRYIRQIIYGFLLQHTTTNTESHNEKCCSQIEELSETTEPSNYFVKMLMPVFTLNGSSLPNLCDVFRMDDGSLQTVISLVLDTEVSCMLSVPRNLQLLFASISYWLKNYRKKKTEEAFIYALVINLMYFKYILKRPDGDIRENRNASDSGIQAAIDNSLEKDAEKATGNHNASDSGIQGAIDNSLEKDVEKATGNRNASDSGIQAAIDNILEKDAKTAIGNIEKFFTEFSWRKIDCKHTIRCFSELQTCILFSGYLNILLGRQFEPPNLHKCFSGTLLHNLTRELRGCKNPDSFVEQLLGGNSLSEIFTLLKSKMLENVPPECFNPIHRPS